MSIEVIPINFKKNDKDADFKLMIQDEKYNDALFLYNDDVESRETCAVSRYTKGNAIIRKYNINNTALDKPRSAGIVTGYKSKGGFDKLDEATQDLINGCFDIIIELIKKYHYKKVIYSATQNTLIGCGVFNVSLEVRQYITNKILDLEKI